MTRGGVLDEGVPIERAGFEDGGLAHVRIGHVDPAPARVERDAPVRAGRDRTTPAGRRSRPSPRQDRARARTIRWRRSERRRGRRPSAARRACRAACRTRRTPAGGRFRSCLRRGGACPVRAVSGTRRSRGSSTPRGSRRDASPGDGRSRRAPDSPTPKASGSMFRGRSYGAGGSGGDVDHDEVRATPRPPGMVGVPALRQRSAEHHTLPPGSTSRTWSGSSSVSTTAGSGATRSRRVGVSTMIVRNMTPSRDVAVSTVFARRGPRDDHQGETRQHADHDRQSKRASAHDNLPEYWSAPRTPAGRNWFRAVSRPV